MDNTKILFGGLIVLALVFATSFTGMLSFSGVERPVYNGCKVTETGDLKGCSLPSSDAAKVDDLDWRNTYNVPWSFDATVTDVNAAGDQKQPVVPFLYQQGFLTTDERKTLSEVDVQDVNLSSVIRSRIERKSSCTLSVPRVSSAAYTIFKSSNDRLVVYEDGDDDLSFDQISGGSTTADTVEVSSNGELKCVGFDMSKVIHGDRVPEKYTSMSPTALLRIPGSSLSVDLEYEKPDRLKDDDGDGLVNGVDVAPQTPGSKSNGAPNLLEKVVHLWNPDYLQRTDGLTGVFKF